MQITGNVNSLAPLNCRSEIEQLVADCLHTDWAMHIEYAELFNNSIFKWNRWGKVHFAVKSATPVIDAINACRACFPNYHIRLYAEKFKPSTQFIYWVQSPAAGLSSEKEIIKEKQMSSQIYNSLINSRNYFAESK